MKYFFFVILLCNIIFFLWEFNSRPLNTSRVMVNSKTKQIVLLSELPKTPREEVAPPIVSSISSKPESSGDFRSSYKKFVLDGSIGTLGLHFKGYKTGANIIDGSDKYIADFLKSLDLDSQENAKPGLEFNAEQKVINKTEQGKELPEEITEIKQGNEIEKQFCYQVGPFLDEKKLTDWIKLNNLDDAFTRFNQKIKTVTNYLVYYPKEKTYALSKENEQLFISKGINDYWLFTEGKLKGIFSLGMLKKEKRALWLQKKLAKKGLYTKIMPRYKLKSGWFAKILTSKIMTDKTGNISEKQSLSLCDNI